MSRNSVIAVVSAVVVYICMLLKLPTWIFFLGMTSAFVADMDLQKITNSLLIGFFGCVLIFYSGWLSGILTTVVVYLFLLLKESTISRKTSVPVVFLGGIAVLSSGVHGPLTAEILVFSGAIVMYIINSTVEL